MFLLPLLFIIVETYPPKKKIGSSLAGRVFLQVSDRWPDSLVFPPKTV